MSVPAPGVKKHLEAKLERAKDLLDRTYRHLKNSMENNRCGHYFLLHQMELGRLLNEEIIKNMDENNVKKSENKTKLKNMKKAKGMYLAKLNYPFQTKSHKGDANFGKFEDMTEKPDVWRVRKINFILDSAKMWLKKRINFQCNRPAKPKDQRVDHWKEANKLDAKEIKVKTGSTPKMSLKGEVEEFIGGFHPDKWKTFEE